jgi:hypothetical protein
VRAEPFTFVAHHKVEQPGRVAQVNAGLQPAAFEGWQSLTASPTDSRSASQLLKES